MKVEFKKEEIKEIENYLEIKIKNEEELKRIIKLSINFFRSIKKLNNL